MYDSISKSVDIMDKVGNTLLIFIIIAVVILLIAVIYIMYVEKRNSSWLTQRESTIKAVYSLKSFPLLYKIQTRIANKFAITKYGIISMKTTKFLCM